MTQDELRRFIKACQKDGRPEAIALGQKAFDRLQERAG